MISFRPVIRMISLKVLSDFLVIQLQRTRSQIISICGILLSSKRETLFENVLRSKWLIKVRQLVKHPVFNDRRILERVVDDLVTHIEHLTGVQPNAVSDHEQEQLRHLVRFTAGLEEGVW